MLWSPDGRSLAVNYSDASNLSDFSVWRKKGGTWAEINPCEDPRTPLGDRFGHAYFSVKRWVDASTMEVHLVGYESLDGSKETVDSDVQVKLPE